MSRLFLSRSEKRGLLLLLFLLLCVSGGLLYVGMTEREGTSVQLSPEDATELEAFAEATKERKRQREAERTAFATPFPFNPNTADSATLINVGLKSWQVKNLLAYRRAGGRWKDAEDFKRLYGLSEEEYQRLRPYIQIPPPVREVYFTEHDRARQDSLYRLRPEKFTELTVLDLNTVDTLTLRKIPGIGVGYSRSIVSYRQRLGGFVSVAQLKDIEGLPERIEEWFSVGENIEVRTISINKSDFKTLVRHPYLSYEQVKVITTHIRKYGPLRSWKDLQLYPEFTPQDFERLTPYFVFE
ncbi:MAG: helix-hairpin-helix domain-containing protein [Bacteroidaceae bacterium]|nr:helix-hairpin-helix domain-containing protein [Bacteroidaceae bacterium]